MAVSGVSKPCTASCGRRTAIWPAPIVTQVVPLETFYPAEGYHQNYFERTPYQPYCEIVIAPRVAKVRQRYLARLKRG